MKNLMQQVKYPPLRMGVDVGQHGIRIIGLSGREDELTLQRIALTDFNPNRKFSQTLHSLWKTVSHKARGAHCNLGPVSVIVQQVEFPEMDEKDLMSAARIEAEQLIPDFHSMLIDYQFIGRGARNEKGVQPIRVLIVAAPEKAVKERIRLLNEADIEARSIVPDGIALANAVTVLNPPSSGAALAVDIGDAATNLVAISPPDAVVAPTVRFIPGGLRNLTKEGQSDNGEGVNMVHAEGERWLREVERSIQFVSDRLDAPAERILVVGDGARSNELLDWIGQAISIPVIPWNPLENLKRGPDIMDGQFVEQNGHQCAIAIGLALMMG